MEVFIVIDKIVTIVQIVEKEIKFGDKVYAGLMKRAAYNEILKVLKENNYIQSDMVN